MIQCFSIWDNLIKKLSIIIFARSSKRFKSIFLKFENWDFQKINSILSLFFFCLLPFIGSFATLCWLCFFSGLLEFIDYFPTLCWLCLCFESYLVFLLPSRFICEAVAFCLYANAITCVFSTVYLVADLYFDRAFHRDLSAKSVLPKY